MDAPPLLILKGAPRAQTAERRITLAFVFHVSPFRTAGLIVSARGNAKHRATAAAIPPLPRAGISSPLRQRAFPFAKPRGGRQPFRALH